MMQKHRKITLERVEKFHTTESWTDVNLRSMLYRARAPATSLLVWSAPGLERTPYATAVRQTAYKPAHIGDTFGPSWSTHWFKVTLTVPATWHGEVHFLWDAGCEGFIYVNGEPMQGLVGGDGCDRRAEFILSRTATGGESFELMVELAANGMFGVGAAGLINCVDPHRRFALKTCEVALFNRDAWDLLWDFQVIADMAASLPETDSRGAQALYVANSIQNAVWTDDPSTIARGRQIATAFLLETNATEGFRLGAIGHCHIDTAWLWPYAETRRKIARSWATQLRLIDEYPGYKFGASQAVQYEWLKSDYPSLYTRLKAAVADGSFVPLGGTWVEMDCNIPSGESFCRQFLYGQRFFKQEFGNYCLEFWLPDTFGYSAQLPQIIRQSGIRYFLTQKLSWNLMNKFPHHSFHWEGLDGSTVLTHFPPGDTYNSQVSVKQVLFSVSNFKDLERSQDAMLLLGHGDGGGGAQMEMLERMKRMANLRGLPRVRPTTPSDFFASMEANSKPLLKWSGELYFELHRGTYTTHSEVKRGNRRCEFLLREVELWACAGPLDQYPAEELHRLWKLVLLNQFHDVLPGSSITDVYVDCAQHHEEVLRCGHQLLATALANYEQHTASQKRTRTGEAVAASAKALRVYNSLAWPRTEVVQVGSRLDLVSVPALSFASSGSPVPLASHPSANRVGREGTSWVLENNVLRAIVSPHGRLVSLVHKPSKREAIARPGNVFQIFDDVNLFWDAWDTEVFHLEKHREVDGGTVEVATDTPLRSALKLTLKLSDRSLLTQLITLDHMSPRLDFHTHVQWNENRRFLKVEFPTTVNSPYHQATFETQFGHLQRPTHRNTSWDVARFEVCAHKWADLSEHGFGVALLNDCKYGYAVEDNVMRLSLIRSPKAPDPQCDIGSHEFLYSLMPHAGSFQDAGVIQQGYNINVPLTVSSNESAVAQSPTPLFQCNNPAVVLDTVKRAEDAPQSLVLRLYESFGGTQQFQLQSALRFSTVEVVNVLEEPYADGADYNIVVRDGAIHGQLRPFRLLSLKVNLVA